MQQSSYINEVADWNKLAAGEQEESTSLLRQEEDTSRSSKIAVCWMERERERETEIERWC
jgi:hypothetical protein